MREFEMFDHAQCHIGILPNEILSEIQLIATYAHGGYTEQYQFPSVLCRVSRRWRCVAYGSPRIWSFIFIQDEDTLGHTQDRVFRAGGVPLNITIRDPEADLQVARVLESLLPQGDRWAPLDMEVRSVREYAAHSPAELPPLKRISFMESGDSFSLSMSLPQLEYMGLHRSWLCWDPSITFGCLKEFHAVGSDHSVQLPVKKVIEFLMNSPNLEVLEMNDSWVLEEEPANGLSYPVADLPQLKVMQLRGLLPWEIVTLLSCVRTPGLQSLMLSIGPDDPQEYPPTAPQLEEFHFNIPSVRDLVLGHGIMSIATEHILLRMQHIQTLSVIGSWTSVRHAVVSLMRKQGLGEMAARLSKIHIRNAPIPKLHRLLSGKDFTTEAQLLLSHAIWQVRPLKVANAVTSRESAAENEKLLEDLHALIPHLEITEENQWWD